MFKTTLITEDNYYSVLDKPVLSVLHCICHKNGFENLNYLNLKILVT